MAESVEGEAGDLENTYDDPDSETRVGEVAVYLRGGVWNSFTLNSFNVSGALEKSIHLKSGQYILLQIRNNSGVRELDTETGVYVDPQSGIALDEAEITITNLLIRALD